MTVTYRAIWQENRNNLEEVAKKTFEDWVQDNHPELDLSKDTSSYITAEGSEVLVSARTSIEQNGLSLTEFLVREENNSERRTTTLKVTTGIENWIWVDVERVSEDLWSKPDTSSPWLVRSLLYGANATGAAPRWGVVRLTDGPLAVRPTSVQTNLINLIKSPLRECPVVVFAHDYQDGAEITLERAERVCDSLAGVITVRVLTPGAEAVFNNIIGNDYGIESGEARIYLPGDMPANQHRLLDREIVSRSPESAAKQFGMLLQPAMANRRPPPIFDASFDLLRKGIGLTEGESLRTAHEDLAENERTIQRLRSDLEKSQNEVIDGIAELEERDTKIAFLQRRVSAILRKETKSLEESTRIPEEVSSIAEAISAGREYLAGVVIPKNIKGDLEELDQTLNSRTWGNSIWRGLVALNTYALQTGRNPGGFHEWCKDAESARVWNFGVNKYAADESDTVKRKEELRKLRVFPVDREVDSSGAVYMGAHLKIANGLLAPRLYFHDDTGGKTKKIHIGYIGRHLPTARFD
ncbi:MAG: Uncharacterised protein [Acidimicrobiales bacterium AG-410-I20]|nr:MAG: Uncharacterised protein [Acidimicrobiales bacterium AG-410-I20]